jgi:hypothetical protein
LRREGEFLYQNEQVPLFQREGYSVSSGNENVLRIIFELRVMDNLGRGGEDSLLFHWLATGAGIHLGRNDPKRRKLNQNGITGPQRMLPLP